MNHREYGILVVDDEPGMREMLAEYLEGIEGYRVFTAEGAREALDRILPANKVDLVLSDINMPGMQGFDFIRELRCARPDVRHLLMTAYDVERYLDLALEYDVGNIFAKTAPFNFHELSTTIDNLLTDDIFGPERYFESVEGSATIKVTSPDRLHDHAREAIALTGDTSRMHRLELVIVELLTNAIYYGIRNETSGERIDWNHDFVLPHDKAVALTVMWDKEKYAISIVDDGGRLSKKEVLFWLYRQTAKDENGLPLGITDTHGRGLFIARKYIDRLIINIRRNRKTEVIIINYPGGSLPGSKPLHINEV